MSEQHRILVVDDHDDFRRGLEALHRRHRRHGGGRRGRRRRRGGRGWRSTSSPTWCSWTCTCRGSTASRPPRGSSHLAAHRRRGAHDARGRRVGVRGRAGRRARLPAQGRPAGRDRRAIEAVGSGEVIFGPGIAERMMGYFRQVQAGPAAGGVPGAHRPRARGARARSPSGRENAEIAKRARRCRPRRCATTRATSS